MTSVPVIRPSEAARARQSVGRRVARQSGQRIVVMRSGRATSLPDVGPQGRAVGLAASSGMAR